MKMGMKDAYGGWMMGCSFCLTLHFVLLELGNIVAGHLLCLSVEAYGALAWCAGYGRPPACCVGWQSVVWYGMVYSFQQTERASE